MSEDKATPAPEAEPVQGARPVADQPPSAEKSEREKSPAGENPSAGMSGRSPGLEEEAEAQVGDQLAGAVNGWTSGASHVTINGSVNMMGGTIGAAIGGWTRADGSVRMARTGRIPDEEISYLCGPFAEPPEFWAAAEALEHDHIVVLVGTGGTGKRTSAIRLLREVLPGPLEVVSPTSTLENLAEYEFEEGHGYLLEGWQDAQRASTAGDFMWRVLSDHVEDRKARLVITATTTSVVAKGVSSVRAFAWKAPSVPQVLAAYLAGTDAQDIIGQLAERLPATDYYEIGQVASVGRRLADGAEVQAILDELSEDPARFTRDWLSAEARTEQDLLVVVALAFAVGQTQRIFDVMLKRLESTLQAVGMLPGSEQAGADKDKGKDETPRDASGDPRSGLLKARINRNHKEGLLRRESVTEGGVSWEVVSFRGEASHREALAGLWHDFDMTFWIPVREWLSELIADTTVTSRRDAAIQVSVAHGLALLAPRALAEVEESYLNPWAAGERGWAGQQAAMYALWWMSLDDSLAPIALRIATNWANAGDPVRQWTAAFALSGQLGAVYPIEAARRLLHLIGQWKDIPTEAIVAMGNLFAILTRQGDGDDAYQILELLRDQLRPAGPVGQDKDNKLGRPPRSWRDDRRNRERAMLSILRVLGCTDPVTRQPAVVSFLQSRPEQLPLVAELWAEVLRSRPYRRRALVTLLEAVRGFKYASDDPEGAARSLGDALSAALPIVEHQPLMTDFANVHKHSKRPQAETAGAVQALLNAIEHLKSTQRAAT